MYAVLSGGALGAPEQKFTSMIDVLNGMPRGCGFDTQNSFKVDFEKVDSTVQDLGRRCFVFYEGVDDTQEATIVPLKRTSQITSDVVVTLLIRIRGETGLEQHLVFPTKSVADSIADGWEEEEEAFMLRASLDVKDEHGRPVDPVRKAVDLLGTSVFREGLQYRTPEGCLVILLGGREFPITYVKGKPIIDPFRAPNPELDPEIVVPVHVMLDLTPVVVAKKASLIDVLAKTLFHDNPVVVRIPDKSLSVTLVNDVVNDIEACLRFDCRDGDQKVLYDTLKNATNAFPKLASWDILGHGCQRVLEWLRQVEISAPQKYEGVLASDSSTDSEADPVVNHYGHRD